MRDVTLVTNDLNMLLKAQTLGIPVAASRRRRRGRLGAALHHPAVPALPDPAHHPRGRARGVRGRRLHRRSTRSRAGRARRSSRRSSRRCSREPAGGARRAHHAADQPQRPRGAAQDGATSTSTPNDAVAADRRRCWRSSTASRASGTTSATSKLSPQDNDARADLASLLLLHRADRPSDPRGRHGTCSATPTTSTANFNLGIFYGQGRRDYPAAIAQFEEGHRPDPERPQPARGLPAGAHGCSSSSRSSREPVERHDRRSDPVSREHIDIAIVGGGPGGTRRRSVRRPRPREDRRLRARHPRRPDHHDRLGRELPRLPRRASPAPNSATS